MSRTFLLWVTHMARRTSRLHPAATAVESAIMPTLERREHGLIERLIRPIADESGGSARPYRAVDTLAVMERRGSITASMKPRSAAMNGLAKRSRNSSTFSRRRASPSPAAASSRR